MASVFLIGCAPKAIEPPHLITPQESHGWLKEAINPVGDAQVTMTPWWKQANDPQLIQLIHETLSHAPKLLALRARLAQAESHYHLAQTMREPSLIASSNATTNAPSRHDLLSPPFVPPRYETAFVGLSLGYDLDLWGKLDAVVAEKLGKVRAQEAEYEEVALTLSTGLSAEYYHYGYLQDQKKFLMQATVIAQENHAIAKARQDAGLEGQDEATLSETKTIQIAQELALCERSIISSKRLLADLSGLPLAQITPYLPTAYTPPTGYDHLPLVMADTLAQKPEIRIKKELVLISDAGIDYAKAGFYPNINLSAMAGLASLGFVHLMQSDSLSTSMGMGISLPLFDRQALSDNYHAANDAKAAAIYDYNDAVIRSANETLWSLNLFSKHSEEYLLASYNVALQAQRLSLAQSRFSHGISDKRPLMREKLEQITRQRALLEARWNRTLAYIDIIRATGGITGEQPCKIRQ